MMTPTPFIGCMGGEVKKEEGIKRKREVPYDECIGFGLGSFEFLYCKGWCWILTRDRLPLGADGRSSSIVVCA